MDKSVWKSFLKYVSLNILGMIGLSCYILADTYFVANALGPDGLAALNLSISIYSVIHGVGLMIGIGGATRFTILNSRGESENACSVFHTAVMMGIAVGAMFAAAGLFGARHLSLILGADQSILPLTQTYLVTILSFSPFFLLNNILLSFVRNDKNPNLAMVAMLVGSFSNIVLDYVFMFPFEMGIFGAAFATGLAPIISIFVLMFHFVKKKERLVFFGNRISWSFVPDIVVLGLSAFVTEVSSAVVLITFNLVILNLAGNLGVAAYGVVANLALVGIAVFTGLAQGIQPLISRYYGLGDEKTLWQIRKYAWGASIALALLIYVVIFGNAERIVLAFNRENNQLMARMAENGLKIYFLGFFFVGVNMVSAMYLSAAEKAKSAFYISIARGLVIIVPLVLVLSRILHMTGVWLSFVLTELIVTVLAVYLGKQQLRVDTVL